MNERVIPNSERKRVSSFENFVEFSSLCVQTKLVILKPPRNDQVKKKKKRKKKKERKSCRLVGTVTGLEIWASLSWEIGQSKLLALDSGL